MQADPGFDLRIADMPIGHGVCAPRSGATNAPPLRGFHSAQVRVFHNHRTTSRMPAVVQSAHCADARLRRVSLCRWPLAEKNSLPAQAQWAMAM